MKPIDRTQPIGTKGRSAHCCDRSHAEKHSLAAPFRFEEFGSTSIRASATAYAASCAWSRLLRQSHPYGSPLSSTDRLAFASSGSKPTLRIPERSVSTSLKDGSGSICAGHQN